MNAKIIGQDDRGIGVRVTDNGGVNHTVSVGFDGEIQGHSQDGYPDRSAERTDEGNVRVYQAGNYARYYVYRERGYETVERHRNPDYLVLAVLAVAGLPTDGFERHFGDLYRQLRSHSTDTDAVVEVHDALEDAYLLYAQELYLGIDADVLQTLREAVPEDALRAFLRDVAAQLDADPAGVAGVIDDLEGLGTDYDFGILGATGALDATDLIHDVSGVCPQWRVGHEIHREDNDIPDVDREPDARVEIVQYTPESIEAFQEYVVHHLKCQVRDSFVGMGVVPPAPFRVLGPGTDYLTGKQQVFDDALQPYYDPEADVDWTEV